MESRWGMAAAHKKGAPERVCVLVESGITRMVEMHDPPPTYSSQGRTYHRTILEPLDQRTPKPRVVYSLVVPLGEMAIADALASFRGDDERK